MSRKNIKTMEGVAAIVAASLLWSIGFLIRKQISTHLGPFTVTFTEVFSGSLLTMLIYRIAPQRAWRAARKGGWQLLLMAFFGVTLANSSFVFGFRFVGLSVGSILEKTQPIFMILLGALFLKERLSPLSLCFGLLGILGAVGVLPFAEGEGTALLPWQTAIGCLFIIAAAFLWAAAGILARKLAVADLGPANMAALRAGIGALTVLPLVLLFEFPHGSLQELLPYYGLAALNGFIETVLCYVLYYHGMKTITAGVTGTIEILTPVGAVMLGVFVLHEQLVLRQWLGAATVLIAVTLLVWNEIRRYRKAEQKDIMLEMKP